MLSRSIARRVAVPMYSHRFLSQVAVMKVIRGSGPKTQGPFDVKRVTPDYSTAIAARDIAKDEIIGTTHGTIYSAPTRFTIQMSDTKHVEIFGGMEYANHSCNPNALFIMSETDPVVTLVAIKPIAKGQDITFDYNTTEWDMDEKFQCRCGNASCRGLVHGAKHLNDAQVLELLPHFSSSILRSLLKQKLVQG